MNIEALAREAGGSPPNQRRNFWEFLPADLTRFAALIRAQALEEAAQAAEAAGIAACDSYGDGAECIATGERCAEAVRALKDKP